MKYNLFIGRYQSPHVGHMHIFNTYSEKGKHILIAVRDIVRDENNVVLDFSRPENRRITHLFNLLTEVSGMNV